MFAKVPFAVVAICEPFLNTLYPATPTLSVDALQERSISLEEMVAAVRPWGCDGGVVSGGGGGGVPPTNGCGYV